MAHYLIRRGSIPVDVRPIQCQDKWRDGCRNLATWQVGCGPNVWYFCDSHEGPPCGGIFADDFVITPDITREELRGVVNFGAHRIKSVSDRDVHELRCCACGEWVGDTLDSDIEHVSVSLDTECRPDKSRDTNEMSCCACGRS